MSKLDMTPSGHKTTFFATSVMCMLLWFITTTELHAQSSTTSCSFATSQQYVPSRGRSITREFSTTPLKYVYLQMYWHELSRLAWLRNNSDSTFELDTIFYNYNGEGFAKAPSGSWGSNLPRRYVDTTIFDIEEERAVTIGSANSSALLAKRNYYYWTQAESNNNNNTQTSWVKIQAQRGRRIPAWCHSTFCSFGCDANNRENVITFQDRYVAPGCRRFWYNFISPRRVASC